jgi:hypothetical protein
MSFLQAGNWDVTMAYAPLPKERARNRIDTARL